jgi:hypothetical protein
MIPEIAIISYYLVFWFFTDFIAIDNIFNGGGLLGTKIGFLSFETKKLL